LKLEALKENYTLTAKYLENIKGNLTEYTRHKDDFDTLISKMDIFYTVSEYLDVLLNRLYVESSLNATISNETAEANNTTAKYVNILESARTVLDQKVFMNDLIYL
jgi:hypothetical protein